MAASILLADDRSGSSPRSRCWPYALISVAACGEQLVSHHGRSYSNAAYQVAFSTFRGRPLLADARRAVLFCAVLGRLRRRLGFALHAYVLLPNVVSMILGALDEDPRSVRFIVQQLRSRFAREVNTRSGRAGLVWQDGINVMRLVSPRQIVRRAHYLHRHPIRARLATEARDWRWSSYLAWTGEGRPPIGVDLPDGVVDPIIR